MAGKPETQGFHPGSYTLDYVARNLALPQVVRCDHAHHCSGGGVGCDTALLLYSSRDTPKVTGALLTEDGPDRKLKEIGENIVIPSDYDGWFTVFRSKPKAKHVPLYHDMPSLMEAGCDVVLVGGKRTLQATQEEDGEMKTVLVQPGTILKLLGITRDTQYIQCTDSAGNTLCVDRDSRGVFYMISRRNKKPMKVHVMQIQHILYTTKMKMPCLVKLIQGGQPFRHPTTQGWIKLTGVEQCSSFVAATVSLKENGIVELQRQSPMTYKLATMNKGWQDFSGYKAAKKLCDKFAGIYSRGIKSTRLEVVYGSDLVGGTKRRSIPESEGSIVYKPLIQATHPLQQGAAMSSVSKVGSHTHKLLRQQSSHTYLTPVESTSKNNSGIQRIFGRRWHSEDDAGYLPESDIYANRDSIVEASLVNHKQHETAAAPPPCRVSANYVNVSNYVNVTMISNEDSFSNLSFSDEWGDDDHDYVNVDGMYSDNSDDDSTGEDYLEVWSFKQNQGQGQRSSVCDSGVFSVAGTDVGQDLL